jgi:hypothetical protein
MNFFLFGILGDFLEIDFGEEILVFVVVFVFSLWQVKTPIKMLKI